MGNQMVEFGGVSVSKLGIYFAVVRSEKQLKGLSALGTQGSYHYYLGVASGKDTDTLRKLSCDTGTTSINFDSIRNLLCAPLPGPTQWAADFSKKMSLAELANLIVLGLHLA